MNAVTIHFRPAHSAHLVNTDLLTLLGNFNIYLYRYFL